MITHTRDNNIISQDNFDIHLHHLQNLLATPLRMLLDITKSLQQTLSDKQQVRLVDEVKFSANELLHIIEKDIANHTKAGVPTREINLRTQLAQMAIKYKQVAAIKEVDFDLKIDSRIAQTFLEEENMRILFEVLDLVLEHSVYSTNRGFVRLKCELIDAKDDSESIRFQMIDTSKGIRKEELRKIMTNENFYLCHYLHDTKKQLKRVNSRLQISSERNLGTSIDFTMTFYKKNQKDKTSAASNTQSFEGIRILLVEDLEMNQLIATEVLQNWGAKVTLAEDGTDAVRLMKDVSSNRLLAFDIILMDIELPTMNGLRATQIIRKELQSLIPIIALTSNTRDEDRKICLDAGMDEYIKKPFDRQELFDKISDALENISLIRKQESVAPQINMNTSKNNNKTTSTQPNFDLTKLRNMCNDNEQMVNKMLQSFAAKTPAILQQLNENLLKKDFTQVADIAHKLKAPIDMIDIQEITADIRQIESCTKTEINYAQLSAQVNKVNQVCNSVIAYIHASLK